MAAAAPTTKSTERHTERRPYWIGLTRDCPLYVLPGIRGHAFHQETEAIIRNADGSPAEDPRSGMTKMRARDGAIEMLTGEEVERIRADVAGRTIQVFHLPDKVGDAGEVVETNRMRARAVRRHMPDGSPNPRYAARPDDVPLGRYVYVLPADERGKYGDAERPTTLE